MPKNNRLVLMVTSSSGSKYFNINAIFKQIGLYTLVFIVTLMIFGVVAIKTLSAEIANISKMNKLIQDHYEEMLSKNESLNEQIEQTIAEISQVDDRVMDLEGKIGIEVSSEPSEAQNDLEHRIDAASLTGAQKTFTLKFIPNGFPMQNYRISADYGYRVHPLFFTRHLHTGIDFATATGTPVYATADGVVNSANFNTSGYGYLVKIDHALGFMTYYAHLSKIVVKKGAFVKKGQLIAYSGNTGQSTGPHLHYEIRFLGNVINPRNFVGWTMSNFESVFEKERSIAWQSLLATINNLME